MYLQNVYYTWKQLGVDAIYLAHYTYSNTEWMLQMIDYIRSKDPNILIMSDYSLNNEETLEAYGDALEGVVIPAPYSIQENEKMGEFREKYESKYKKSMSNVAVQGYDLIHMFGKFVKEGKITGEAIVSQMKSKEGYQGVTGTIQFSETGKLLGIPTQYLV